MRFTYVIAIILAMANGFDNADRPFHSKPWICTHIVKKLYDNAIWNILATPGVDCFDDLMVLPDKIKGMTPIMTFHDYMVVGPYIGNSKTFRAVAVVEDRLESIDLGTKLEGKFAVECLKCNGSYYGNNIGSAMCNELTMEECPKRLSEEMYWNPPGNITSSSDAEFCLYRNENGKQGYICMFLEAGLDVVS
ncbi:uncharacterized protein [Ptychodera flava]|uniref:uncharacterized protein n=1 Tax=Ptychodera flava TaxID=63121 RepID=UPI00396A935E